MRNGLVTYLSSAVSATLSIFVLAGYLPEKLAAAIVVAVGAWATLLVAVNDYRKKTPPSA